MAEKIVLTGLRFGRWLVLEQVRVRPGITHWRCRCDCGNESVVFAQTLREGHSRSCGCLQRELSSERASTHALSGTSFYNRWCAIIGRCYNPNNTKFHRYGKRGIRMCEFIRTSPANLLLLIGPKPAAGMSIGRPDNDGHYSCGKCAECLQREWPLNVRWETATQQARNRRTSSSLSINGETKTIAEWAELSGLKSGTIWFRVKHRLDPLKALP